MVFVPPTDFKLFKQRRASLMTMLRMLYPTIQSGIVLLSSGFEQDRYIFRPESNFYYVTGISEPGSVLCSFLDGTDTLFVPHYGEKRDQWVTTNNLLGQEKKLEMTRVGYLGDQIKGYTIKPQLEQIQCSHLLEVLKGVLDQGGLVFYAQEMRSFFEICSQWLPELHSQGRDISQEIARLRRYKDDYEVNLIYKAIQITEAAHRTAAQSIAPGRFEYQVQAMVEYIFTELAAASPAFPSIVASGKNSTILHYTDRSKLLTDGDLVVVDIGASYGYYAADLTRTYPVGGTFSARQREIYNMVLAVQSYVESIAQPGMFLCNAQKPDMSLNHRAIKQFEQYGYAKYVTHGIGHYLGLDVHDVGDHNQPLAVGDVFTLEPGIYIPEENLGIRIEDDYIMADDGAACLSYGLEKTPEAIEALCKQQ